MLTTLFTSISDLRYASVGVRTPIVEVEVQFLVWEERNDFGSSGMGCDPTLSTAFAEQEGYCVDDKHMHEGILTRQ